MTGVLYILNPYSHAGAHLAYDEGQIKLYLKDIISLAIQYRFNHRPTK